MVPRVALKRRLKDALRPMVSALPDLSGLPSWPRTMGMLHKCGFKSATVLDISRLWHFPAL